MIHSMLTHHEVTAMNTSKARTLNAEDRLVSRMTLTFLATPLVLLMLAALTIAVTSCFVISP